MENNTKKLITKARSAFPDSALVIGLCDALANSLDINEQTLDIKLKLNEENQRLRTSVAHLEGTLNAVLEAAGEDWQDVDNLPNVVKAMAAIVQHRQAAPASQQQQLLEQMIADLQKLANPQNPVVPPMSVEMFRQHAALTALNGLLAGKGWTGDHSEIASEAVIAADALVQELAK